jgi:hypothetical protein
MIDTEYARILKSAMAEFEDQVVRQVEAAFEGLPLDARELPWIGGDRYAYCDRATQKQAAVRALVARQWFEFESPRWAWPLPLSVEDCVARFNGVNRGSRRGYLVGQYGISLRGMGWQLQHAVPFEIFCAHEISPPA